MAQSYDVALKAMFLREGNGIIRRKLFGGKVTEVHPTEQPKVSNHRADLVVRTEDGKLHQIEFQAENQTKFARRLLGYYVYIEGEYGEHVTQTVLYMGRDPLRMADYYSTPTLHFRFEIVNLRELDAEPLLESPDWTDKVLALLAKGSPERALELVLPKIRALKGEEQELAAGTLTLLSGILGMEDRVGARLEEVGMIDVMQNKILGPAIRKGLEMGREEGRRQEAERMLHDMVAAKFGSVPAWAKKRLAAASQEDLSAWSLQILRATTIEEVFG